MYVCVCACACISGLKLAFPGAKQSARSVRAKKVEEFGTEVD